jgi:NTE family protein
MKRLGICFSGGGARGAYQVGVCKALEELGYFKHVYAFSGTSIGAVNASLLATKPIDEVKRIWVDFPREEVSYIENLMKMIRNRDFSFVKNGIGDIAQLEHLLEQNLDREAIKNHKVYITLSPAGLSDEGAIGIIKASFSHYIRKQRKAIYSPLHKQKIEDINKQIIASCSIPFIFSPVTMDGKQLFDGGLYDNIPIKPLAKLNCDTVIVINLQRFLRPHPKRYPGIDIIEIKHKRSLGAVLNFERNQSIARFDLGYQDAIAYFKDHPLEIN